MRIRDRIALSGDVESELQNLYRVERFADFAMGLLWVMDAATNHPEKICLTEEEERLLLDRFMQAVGTEEGPGAAVLTPYEDAITPVESEVDEQPPEEEVAQPGGVEEVSLAIFAMQFEAFVEAMQAGDEHRVTLLSEIRELASRLQSLPDPECARVEELCELLIDFLGYITEEQFLDDVRVMNILSNISGDATVWLEPNGAKREESIAEAIGILKNFRSLFE